VPIPVDKYFIVTPSSQFISKAYASLNGTDLFFFVNDLGNLRVVNMQSGGSTATPGSTIFTLAQVAKWVDVIARPGVVYVYYEDLSGDVWLIPYRSFGGLVPAPTLMPFVQAVTVSTIYTAQSSPPAYMAMVDDGIRHHLYVSQQPTFETLLAPSVVTYNNLLDTTIYLSQPSIAMHPSDDDRVTVTFQETIVMSGVTNVGFYEVRVQGVA
jgi:hypothetical protein